MHSIIAAGVISTMVTLSPPVKELSPERIQELVKKLEVSGPPGGLRGVRIGSEVWELARSGSDAIPPLLALSEETSKSGPARAHAAIALAQRLDGFFTIPDPRVLEVVRKAMKDKDSTVRWGILARSQAWYRNEPMYLMTRKEYPDLPSLHAITFPVTTFRMLLPDFAAAVADPDPEVAKMAAFRLGFFGEPGIGLPELLAALNRKEKAVRAAAIWAIGKVGCDDPVALKAVLELLDSKGDLEIYDAAIYAIGGFGPKAKTAVPKLIEALKDGRGEFNPFLNPPLTGGPPAFHLRAVVSLGQIGPASKDAVPLILTHLESPHIGGRDFDEALGALERIGPDAGKQGRAIEERKKAEFRKLNNPPAINVPRPQPQ